MSLPNENSVFCDLCGSYNIDCNIIICKECLLQLLNLLKEKKLTINELIELIDKEDKKTLDNLI